MNVTQHKQQRTISLTLRAAAISAVLILGGCATERPIAVQGLEQRIETARTESDHRDLAATYEQQASVDKESAERHRRFAQNYAKSFTPVPPWGSRGGSVPKVNPTMVKHCENLANLYEQASMANLELAAEHRRAAGVSAK